MCIYSRPRYSLRVEYSSMYDMAKARTAEVCSAVAGVSGCLKQH